MILPDVNLLVYAYHLEDPRHQDAREWWESLLNGGETIALPWLVTCGFIRIMTSPRVLKEPMEIGDAIANVRSWLERPHVMVIEPGHQFADIFFSFLEQAGIAGNITTDAQLAALAVEHQAQLHSNDTDFSRFQGLRWSNPLKPGKRSRS